MKRLLAFVSVSILFSCPAWAWSSLDCTSNQNTTYFNHHPVGGPPPFPGMITNIEEIRKNNEPIYRIVIRQACDDHHVCTEQNPELKNIEPANFSFSFDQATKRLIATEGTMNSPVYKETYVIRFHSGFDSRIDRPEAVWMLCDYVRMLVP